MSTASGEWLSPKVCTRQESGGHVRNSEHNSEPVSRVTIWTRIHSLHVIRRFCPQLNTQLLIICRPTRCNPSRHRPRLPFPPTLCRRPQQFRPTQTEPGQSRRWTGPSSPPRSSARHERARWPIVIIVPSHSRTILAARSCRLRPRRRRRRRRPVHNPSLRHHLQPLSFPGRRRGLRRGTIHVRQQPARPRFHRISHLLPPRIERVYLHPR